MDTTFNVPFNLLLSELGFSGSERKYFLKRFYREGITFATKILPVLWKGCLMCIENRTFNPEYFKYKGGYPFNWKDSSLRRMRLELEKHADGVDSPYFVYQLSQLCQYLYKLALPSDDDQILAASEKFITTNTEVGEFQYDPDYVEGLRKYIETEFRHMTTITFDSIVGKIRDGSGAVANSTMNPREYKDSLDSICPVGYGAFSGAFRARKTDISSGRRLRVTLIDHKFSPTKIAFVPKDSRGPRTIGIEDVFKVKVQMGFHDHIKGLLERHTHGRIQFTDQSIMQDQAYHASITKDKSTLDLEEASDRNAYRIAKALYNNFPFIRRTFMLARSTEFTLVSAGSTHTGKLNSVGGMGSGLTFPLLAWTIWSTVCYYVKRFHGDDIRREVYVYGDDIIVPTKYYASAKIALEKVGLRLNVGKSFYKSCFRESCGGDYYNGNTVTPERLKLTFSKVSCRGTSLTIDEQALIKLERHCRRLVKAGLTKLADYYYQVIERALGSSLPVSANDQVPYLVRYKHDAYHEPDALGHHGELRGYTARAVERATSKKGLNRSFRSHLTSMTRVSLEDELFPGCSSPFGTDYYRYRIQLSPVTIPAFELNKL